MPETSLQHFPKHLLKHCAQHCCTVCPPLKHVVQCCAQQFWIVKLDPTSAAVACNVSRNIAMGGHTLQHCVARDVSQMFQEVLHRVSGP